MSGSWQDYNDSDDFPVHLHDNYNSLREDSLNTGPQGEDEEHKKPRSRRSRVICLVITGVFLCIIAAIIGTTLTLIPKGVMSTGFNTFCRFASHENVDNEDNDNILNDDDDDGNDEG